MIGTKNVEIPEGSGKMYKGINAGAVEIAIMDIAVFTSAGGSKVINLQVEDKTEVEEGYTYTGLLGEHTGTHCIASLAMGSWFKELNDESEAAIAKNIASLANATGTRELVDAIVSTSLEDYLLKVVQIIKGKYFCTIIQEREYLNVSNEVKTSKSIKNLKAGDNYIVLAKPSPEYKIENNTITNGTWSMAFSEEYDIKRVAKPDNNPVQNPVAGDGADDLPF